MSSSQATQNMQPAQPPAKKRRRVGVTSTPFPQYKSSVDASQSRDIRALKKAVIRLSRTDEVKYYDVKQTIQAETTIAPNDLLALDLFTGDQQLRFKQREGQSISVLGWQFHGTLTVPIQPIANTLDYRIRILVVHRPVADAPVISDVLQTGNVFAPNKMKPDSPYRILYDKVYIMNGPAFQSTTQQIFVAPPLPYKVQVKINLNKKVFGTAGKKATWPVGGLTATGPQTGDLALFCWCPDGPIAGPFPVLEGTSRLRFLDQ